jgi:hypothetical protein
LKRQLSSKEIKVKDERVVKEAGRYWDAFKKPLMSFSFEQFYP